MAVREINAVIAADFNIAAATQLHAGAYVARDTTSALVVAADRNLHTSGNCLGILADDTARTGNTIISVDPVGSTYIDPVTGNFIANNNGYYKAAKRALGDYQDEIVTNVTNLTAGAGGFQGPMRGVGVFTTPSSNLITDQFALASTNDSSTSSIADAAFSGGATYLTNDLLTYGTGANAGLLVKISSANFYNGKIIGRVDDYNAAAGLLGITLF